MNFIQKLDFVIKVQRPSKYKKIDEFKFLKGCNIITLVYENKFKSEFISLKSWMLMCSHLKKCQKISGAQSMDVLSSQSNLSGYKAVIDATESLFNKAFL